MPNLVTYVSRTPLLVEWYVVRCGSKNGHQKDTCSEVVGMCAQIVRTITLSELDWGHHTIRLLNEHTHQ